VEAGKDVASALTCKRCTASNRKLGDRAAEFIVDIDFKYVFNAMSQAVPWRVMGMFKIPDVDLLEQIYEGATIRLAPNDEESATTTFNTGVAQRSITSPKLFNIFINARLRMLTVTGQNENISHGLQIGKDQKECNQRDENGYQFNNIGFIDDISIFADKPEGMQTLLNVKQEFTVWCGMQINVKKTYLLVTDNDKKRREQEPASLSTINRETLQAINLDDACRYLGYWCTGNGDMRATKEGVRQKIIAARNLIKCHLLTPELAMDLFTSKVMGVFHFSAALIEWSESELNDVKQLCVQAYKNTWHLPRSTASALFIFPKTRAGKKSTLPMAELTQELLLHAERCMRHEDVSKKSILAGLNRTLDEWLRDSFAELIEEMELWKWDDATGDFWSRLAKVLQQSNISVTWAKQLDCRLASVHTTGKLSWAVATRSIREFRMRIKRIGGSRLDTDSDVWGLDQTTWELMWAGEAAIRKSIPALSQAGYENISDCLEFSRFIERKH